MEITTIYQEFFFPRVKRIDAYQLFIDSSYWTNLFSNKEKGYSELSKNSEGLLYWRSFFGSKYYTPYKVVSYKKSEHILIDMRSNDFSSTLLVTIEEKQDGSLIRLDHRSFIGPKSSRCSKYFANYWKKMSQSLINPLKD